MSQDRKAGFARVALIMNEYLRNTDKRSISRGPCLLLFRVFVVLYALTAVGWLSASLRGDTQACTPMITAYDCGGKYGTPASERCYPEAGTISIGLTKMEVVSTYPPPTQIRYTFRITYAAHGYQYVPTAPFKATLYMRVDSYGPQAISTASSLSFLPPLTYFSCVGVSATVCYSTVAPITGSQAKFWLKAYQTSPQGYAYCQCEGDTVPFSLQGAVVNDPPPLMMPLLSELGSTDCQGQVGDPINVTNGNMFLQKIDVSLPTDLGLPLQFTRYYNSYTSDTSSSLKSNWRHSLEYSLSRDSSSGDYTLLEATGRQITFKKHVLNYGYGSVTTYSAPYAAPYRFRADTSANACTVIFPDETRLIFQGLGGPDSLGDLSGNKLKLFYTGSVLDSVRNASGRKLVFGYSSGRLAALVAANGDTLTKYDYHPNTNLLRRVTYSDSSWEQYDYGDNSYDSLCITGVSSSDGTVRYYSYDSYGRAVENQLAGGYEKVNLEWIRPDSCSCDPRLEVYDSRVAYQDDSLVSHFYHIFAPEDSQRVVTRRQNADCDGCATEYEYDALGLKKLIKHPNGTIDSVWYDGRGNLLRRVLAANTSSRQTLECRFDSTFCLPTLFRRPSVAKSSSDYDSLMLTYDAKGNLTKLVATGWKSSTSTYRDTSWLTYNTASQLIKFDGPRRDVADTIKYVYYANGDLQYLIQSNADTTAFGQRDQIGKPTWVRSPNRDTTRLYFDQVGRLSRIIELAGTADSTVTTLSYNVKGELKSTTSRLGSTVSLDYDSTGYLRRITEPLRAYSSQEYDPMGNTRSIRLYSAADSMRWDQSYYHDNKHKLLWAAGRNTDTTRFHYADGGVVDTFYNAANVKTVNRYDGLLRVTDQVSPWSSDSVKTRYTYDTRDNITKVMDPNGFEYVYRYDDKNRLVFDSCAVTGVTRYGYDAASNVSWLKNAANDSIAFKYDALNRLTARLYPDSQNVRYSYDGTEFSFGRSRLYKESAPACTTRYRYDGIGRVSQELRRFPSDTATYRTSYEYDKNDNLTSITYPSGTQVAYDYDSSDNVRRVRCYVGGVWDTLASSASYAPFGSAESWTLGNGLTITNRLDLRYLLDSLSTGADSIAEFRYTYDVVGNITAIADRYDTLASRQFGYDDINRLISARSRDYPDTLVRFVYARNGNRDTLTFYGSAVDTSAYSYTSNRLSQVSGDSMVAFSYDALGNVTRRIVGTDTTTFEYNDADRLMSIDGGATASYSYDGIHRRVEKVVGGTGRKYIPAPNGYVLSEYDLSNGWQGDYVYLNGRPLAILTANAADSVLYFVNDHLGTPVALVDNNRLKRWSVKWYPFGDIYSEQVSATNQIRFPGQWRDDEGDLSYNWNRYYSPEEGRYYQADPLGLGGGDYNTYRYASSNPVGSIDPYGLWVPRWDNMTRRLTVVAELGDHLAGLFSQLGISAGEFSGRFGIGDVENSPVIVNDTKFDITSFVLASTEFNPSSQSMNCYSSVLTGTGAGFCEQECNVTGGYDFAGEMQRLLGFQPVWPVRPGDVVTWVDLAGTTNHAAIYVIRGSDGTKYYFGRRGPDSDLTIQSSILTGMIYRPLLFREYYLRRPKR